MEISMATFISTRETFINESELAWHLKRLKRNKIDKIDPDTEGLLYNQTDAVVNACKSPVSILTGFPGTGKTTTLKNIIKSFNKAGLRGICIAPYGKAAKKIEEVLSVLDNPPRCMTIHKGLVVNASNGKFNFNYKNQLREDYVIVDETSTLGTRLANSLFSAIGKKTRVILTGDVNQIPSIEPGNVLHDIIKSGIFPVTNLTNVIRQSEDSGIVFNSIRLLQGKPPLKENPTSGKVFDDWFFVPREVDKAPGTILNYVSEKIPAKKNFDKIKDIQVLSPGKKSVVGTNNLNDRLCEVLNKDRKPTKYGIAVNDKVINKRNNSELNITNGDVGIVKETTEAGFIVDFDGKSGPNQDGIVEIVGEQIKSIKLAYAYTIHSSQGSEFRCTIVPVYNQHYILLNRNLLFTADTRAKDLHIFVGDEKALKIAIRKDGSTKRETNLLKLLS